MPKQRFGLGRGLDALIPGAPATGAPATRPTITHVSDETLLDTSLSASVLFEVPIDAITPNPQQPRAPTGEDDQLMELATSIGQFGLLQPLLVAVVESDEDEEPLYQLIAGERRWRAARLAGLERVPVVIRDVTPQLMLELALVENLQRADLNPLEEAQGYLMLQEEYHLTQEQIAARVGRNRATIANTIRLLQLPEEVREYLLTLPNVFTEGHARAVLQIVGDAERMDAAKLIIAQRMSVRQAEELARRYNQAALRLTPDRRGGAGHQQSFEIRALEEEFTRAIEMKVRLQRNTRGKGSLTLYFANEDQLQTLYDRLVAARQAMNGQGALDFDGADAPNGPFDRVFGGMDGTER
ncbi:MAG: ParB/RepB/Spo0J family partition protein [Ktedonobacterales bacterium]|nr:ParB/RepB/Spo0J family partition protein [Ktedonobacterales bacterium]